MSESSIILTVVEPDCHPQEVVRRAVWLAEMYDCEIELLWCDPNVGPLGESFFLSNEAAEIKSHIRTAQQEILDDLAALARDTAKRFTPERMAAGMRRAVQHAAAQGRSEA